MSKEIYLTGITTTGTPHIGNYVGAIRPAVASSHDHSRRNFYFLADYHSLAKAEDPERIHRSSLEVAATWLACGLDTDNAVFYRQSDIPEILELTWILNGVTNNPRISLAMLLACMPALSRSSPTSGSNTTNSSPPRRDTVSSLRSRKPMVRAAWISNSSPTA